MTNSWRLKK